jgi:NitT/TauT family transport system permease protein
MQQLKSIFTFNKILDKPTAMLLVYFQIALLGLFWIFYPSVFLPKPGETFTALSELWAMGAGAHLLTSFKLNLEAIAYSTLISLGLAYSTTIPFFRPFVALLGKLRFLSMIGLTFFFTLMFKDPHSFKLSLLVFSISVFFITSMAEIMNSIPKVQYDLARTLRMKEHQVVWEVVILGQAHKVFDVISQTGAIGWLMLTLVEGLSRSEGGIGSVLLNQNKHFHLSAIMGIQISILILGLTQDYLVAFFKDFFCPFAKLTMEKK